jgi:hypothetical protein
MNRRAVQKGAREDRDDSSAQVSIVRLVADHGQLVQPGRS